MGKHEASMEKIAFYLAKQEKRGKLTTADQVDLAREINVSHMTGKLENLSAISTSHWECAFCKKCAKIPGSICSKCYVDRFSYRKGLVNALKRNKLILDNVLLSTTAWKTVSIPTEKLRYQAHGETENSTCAMNFINCSKAHSHNKTALWEKNDGAVAPAFEEMGKPRNMKLLHSSLMINQVGLPSRRIAPFIDHIFTVVDDERNAPLINCGARSCESCGRCYKPVRTREGSGNYCAYREAIEDFGLEFSGHDYYIFELLK